MFQRRSSIGPFGSISDSTDLPSHLRVPGLSRGNSTDDDEFVLLSPTHGGHQHGSSSDGEFEFVNSAPHTRTPSANNIHRAGPPPPPVATSNTLSRNVSFSRQTPPSGMSRSSSGNGLAVPQISRALTDYFLAPRTDQDQEQTIKHEQQMVQQQQQPLDQRHPSPPATLSLSRHSSNQPVYSPVDEVTPHIDTDLDTEGQYDPRSGYDDIPYDDGDDGVSFYGRSVDSRASDPPSPDTLAAHHAALAHAEAWSSRSASAGARTNRRGVHHQQQHVSFDSPSPMRVSSSTLAYLDGDLPRSMSSSDPRVVGGVHKSRGSGSSRKEQRTARALEGRRREVWRDELEKSRPTLLTLIHQQKEQDFTPPSSNTAPTPAADSSSTRLNGDVTSTTISKPSSNYLVDRSVSVGSITIRDIAAQLAATQPAHEHRHSSPPPADKGAGKFGVVSRARPFGIGLPQAHLNELRDFEFAFFQHHRGIIEDGFHSLKHGLRIVSTELLPPSSTTLLWSQRLLDTLNDPLGSGREHTRLSLAFHRIEAASNEEDTTRHTANGITGVWNKESNSYKYTVYTPSQIPSLHRSFDAQELIRLEDGRTVRGHRILICGLIHGWSHVHDSHAGQFYRSVRSGGASSSSSSSAYTDVTPFGAHNGPRGGGRPKFDLFRKVNIQQLPGKTIVLDGALLAPLAQVTYVELDVAAPVSQPAATLKVDPASGTHSAIGENARARRQRRADGEALVSSKRVAASARAHGHRTVEQRIRADRDAARKGIFDSAAMTPPLPDDEATLTAVGQRDAEEDQPHAEEDDSTSYLRSRGWNSLSELERAVTADRRRASAAASAVAPRWSELADSEVHQLVQYRLGVEREQREEAARIEEDRRREEFDQQQRQQWMGEAEAGEEEADQQDDDSSPAKSVRLPCPSARASSLSSPYDDLDMPVVVGLLAHSKLSKSPSRLLSTGSLTGFHHNHHANVFMRVAPKRYLTMVKVANKMGKWDVNYPVKPKRQVRLDNARNMRSQVYNQQEQQDEETQEHK